MAIVLTAIALVLQVALYGATIEQHWIRANLPLIVVVALVLSSLFGASFELSRLIGGRVLLSFVLGTYHRPKAENRIIMFLDLAGSTALAERLGEIRLQDLITRVFLDIDEAIVTYQGEIHAYVGDGVLVTWPLRDKLQNGAVVHCFFAIQETLAKHARLYQDRFGVVPRFRASLHAGPVVISECGNSKRQIALFGDAMNVAARLQDYCKSKQSDLVVSGPLLASLQLPWDAEVEAQETVLLRGRETQWRLLQFVVVHISSDYKRRGHHRVVCLPQHPERHRHPPSAPDQEFFGLRTPEGL